MNYNNTCCSN